MPQRRFLARLGAAVAGAIVGIAGTVTVYSLRSPRTAPIENAAAPIPSSASHAADLRANTREAPATHFESDLAAALARIDELYAERQREWQHTAEWVNTLLDSSDVDSWLQHENLLRIRRKIEIRQQAESGDVWAGLDDAMFLLYATLLAGEAAVADLCAMVTDETLDLDERRQAFEALGYLPSPTAIDVLLNPPEDLAAELSYFPADSKGRLALMVDFLSPSAVKPYEDQLNRLAVSILEEDPLDGDAWKLLGALAWEHQSAAALTVLNDPRNVRSMGEELLTVAWWSGTDGGRKYIERIGRTHPTLEIRQKAATILASWPSN